MPSLAIQATEIGKWFGERDAQTVALRGVSLEAYFGEMLYIVGPSGSGKTTMLSVLSGVLRPDTGTVSVEGTDIWSLSPDELAELRLHKIGFVFQDFHLFPRLSTAENVAIPMVLKKEPWDEAVSKAREYLDIVGLTKRADLPLVKLSGGEQQRVAIARAMAAQPEILVMDEPTASLEGDTGHGIVTFVKEQILNDKRCVIVVTHDNRIYDMATRILKMEDGRLSAIVKGESS